MLTLETKLFETRTLLRNFSVTFSLYAIAGVEVVRDGPTATQCIHPGIDSLPTLDELCVICIKGAGRISPRRCDVGSWFHTTLAALAGDEVGRRLSEDIMVDSVPLADDVCGDGFQLLQDTLQQRVALLSVFNFCRILRWAPYPLHRAKLVLQASEQFGELPEGLAVFVRSRRWVNLRCFSEDVLQCEAGYRGIGGVCQLTDSHSRLPI